MPMLRATHLAKVKSEVYEHRWERFFVQRPARIIAVRPCLTGISIRSAEIVDISQGGASFVVRTTVGLPTHYYLNILGLAYRIGCAEDQSDRQSRQCSLHQPDRPGTLRRVVRADFMIGNTEALAARGKRQ